MRFLLSAFSLFFSLALFAQTDQTDAEKLLLRGRVKQYSEKHFDVTGERKQKRRQTEHFAFRFDGKGYIEEEKYYDADGDLKYTLKNDHNGRGYLTEQKKLSKKKDVISRIRYHYNRTGKKLEEVHFKEKNKLWFKLLISYDDRGNPEESKRFNRKGELFQKEVYKYDENLNRYQVSVLDSLGTIQAKSALEYDDNGYHAYLIEVLKHKAQRLEVERDAQEHYGNNEQKPHGDEQKGADGDGGNRIRQRLTIQPGQSQRMGRREKAEDDPAFRKQPRNAH